MVPAHFPETVHMHAQSDTEVICKRGLSWKKKGDPFLERKHRESERRKGNQENLWEMRDNGGQRRCGSEAGVRDAKQKQRTNACFVLVALRVWREASHRRESVLRKS